MVRKLQQQIKFYLQKTEEFCENINLGLTARRKIALDYVKVEELKRKRLKIEKKVEKFSMIFAISRLEFCLQSSPKI